MGALIIVTHHNAIVILRWLATKSCCIVLKLSKNRIQQGKGNCLQVQVVDGEGDDKRLLKQQPST